MAKLSLEPQVLDLGLYAGDGARIRLVVQSPDGSVYPLTGEVASQIRQGRLSPDVIEAFDADMSEAANGVILLTMTGDQTAAMVNGSARFTGVWDVQYIATGAEPLTLVQGEVTCDADVTRDAAS